MSNENASGQGPNAHPETRVKSRRGFASMSPELQREIASKGGQSQGKQNNPGNFANNREKAREAGRKGGEAHSAANR
jgi:general stress protein YciG